jgi:hypothetical protein
MEKAVGTVQTCDFSRIYLPKLSLDLFSQNSDDKHG